MNAQELQKFECSFRVTLKRICQKEDGRFYYHVNGRLQTSMSREVVISCTGFVAGINVLNWDEIISFRADGELHTMDEMKGDNDEEIDLPFSSGPSISTVGEATAPDAGGPVFNMQAILERQEYLFRQRQFDAQMREKLWNLLSIPPPSTFRAVTSAVEGSEIIEKRGDEKSIAGEIYLDNESNMYIGDGQHTIEDLQLFSFRTGVSINSGHQSTDRDHGHFRWELLRPRMQRVSMLPSFLLESMNTNDIHVWNSANQEQKNVIKSVTFLVKHYLIDYYEKLRRMVRGK